MNRKHVSAIMALSLAAVGCGGGGGGGGGSVAGGVTAGAGVIASALPVATRDPQGYSFQSVGLNSVKGAGLVTALGEAPTGTQSLVAHAPLNELERQDGMLVVTEDSFFDKVGSIATVPSSGTGMVTYAATLSVTGAQTGDFFQRQSLTASSAQWSIALDTDKSEAYVASVGSNQAFLGMAGGEGQEGVLYGPGFAQIAIMGSAIPMRAVEYKGLTYIGALGNNVGGGAARLYRMLNGAIEEVNFPASAGGNGVRQEFVGMISVAGTSSPSVAGTQSGSVSTSPVDLLVVAVGNFDRLTHAGMGGQVLVHDGKDWEAMVSFSGEAPSGLALIDNTIYVGTTGGKLLFRDVDGKWVEEPNLPANDGVTALLARDKATLLIGLRGKSGAQLAIRTALGGGIGGSSTPYFLPDVSSILANRCAVCHAAPGQPAAVAVYGITAAANTDADFTATQAKINTTSPAMSSLVVKGDGGNGHVGGKAFQGNEKQVVLDWIAAGAPKEKVIAPPPPPPPPASGLKYLTAVKPILMAKNCATAGCHGNNPGRVYQLSVGLTADNADWNATRNESNPAVPAQSRLLLKASGQSHPVNAIPVGSTEYNTIVQWINDGRQFQ